MSNPKTNQEREINQSQGDNTMSLPVIQDSKDLKQAVSARDLHKSLESTERFSSWFARQLQYGFDEGVDFVEIEFYNEKAYQMLKDYKVTKCMAAQICARQRYSESVGSTANKFDLNVSHVHTYTRFELSFVSMLKQALEEIGVSGEEQYPVLNYRVDFYIPELRLAVEYDEYHHSVRAEKEADRFRQKEIEAKLGCEFVRCDYKEQDIVNAMAVVKRAISKLFTTKGQAWVVENFGGDA